MLTATQVAAIIMFLQAFGVPAGVVAIVQGELAPQITQATTTQPVSTAPGFITATSTTDSQTNQTTNVIVFPAVSATPPLKVPVCGVRQFTPTPGGKSQLWVSTNPQANEVHLDNGQSVMKISPGFYKTSWFLVDATTTVTMTEVIYSGDWQRNTSCATTIYP